MGTGEMENAVQAFQALLKQDPNHFPSYYNLGVIYSRTNRLDLAVEAFKTASRLRPDLVEPLFLLTQVYAAAGRFDEAEVSVTAAIKINPAHSQSHYLLGLIHQSQQRIPEAILQFRTVLRLAGDEASVKGANEQLAIFKKQADIHLNRGIQLYNSGALDESLEAFQQALKFSAGNHLASYSIGLIHKHKSQLALAVESFIKALEVKPDYFSARIHLGETYEMQGRVGLAIREYQSILEETSEPESPEAVAARQKLSQLGNLPELGEEVILHLEKGAELMGRRELEEAKQEFIAVLALIPRHVIAHYSLGLIAIEMQDLDRAEALFLRAIEIDPNHFLSLMKLGALYENAIPKKPILKIFDRESERHYRESIKKALDIYQQAILARPRDPLPPYRLGFLYEDRIGSLEEAILWYKKVLALKGADERAEAKIASARIDFLEQRFNVAFNDAFLSYDSNRNQDLNPQSEITSNLNLGLTYFVVKTDRFRLPIQLNISNSLIHRQQAFFNNEDLSISFITTTLSQVSFVQSYTLSYGFEGGTDRANQSSYKTDTFAAQISKWGSLPTQISLDYNYVINESLTFPVLDATRQRISVSASQNLQVNQFYLGTLQLAFNFLDNDVSGNDLAYRSQGASIGYRLAITSKLAVNLQLNETLSKYRHPDSAAEAILGLIQRRENRSTSWSAGLTYSLEPGLSFYANFMREENRSNLPSFSFDSVLLESGQITSQGSYQRNVITFGASYAADLRLPYPQRSTLGKQLTVALTAGYYRPSLNELDRVMSDPNLIISQDPNNLIPSNPGFLSEQRNLVMPEIEGAMSSGVEVEWAMRPKHALVLSLSEWQNAVVGKDTIPLLLSPTTDPVIVPRSARYNLVVNQVMLGWRYSFWERPEKGRMYLNIGLLGAAFSDLTVDTLVQVEDPPGFDPIAIFGSMEARGTAFTTRFGLGAEYFLSPWVSIGLNAHYLFGTVTKLTVERGFPADFPDIPTGLPGINPSPCFRQVDQITEGEVAEVAVCERDVPVQNTGLSRLKLRLDGFDVQMALRFHFGTGGILESAFGKSLIGDGAASEDDAGFWQNIRSRLALNGSLKNETAYRLFEPVTFTKSLNLFRLNSTYSLSRQLHFTAKIRTFYDAIYDLVDIDTISPRRFPNTVLTQIPQNPTAEQVAALDVENPREVDITKSGFEFREMFLDIETRRVDFRLGRQIVRWGVVEGSRVVDEINPFDFSEFILREIEDRYIPLMMVKTSVYPGDASGDATIDLIWIPEIVPHKPAAQGTEFEQFEILENFVAPESYLDSSLNLKSEAFDNSEVAARIIRNFSGWELSLSGFYTWDDFPSSFRVIEGSVDNPFDNTIGTAFTPEQTRLTIFGSTLSKSFGKVVLNAELSHTTGKFFGTRLQVGPTAGGVTLGELQRDYIKYALELKLAHFNTDFTFAFHEARIFDWQPSILQDEVDSIASFFMRKSFLNDRISAQLLTLYFINEDDFLLRPRFDTSLTDAVNLRFGGDFFIGTRGTQVGEFDFIGFFNDSNRIYLEIIYSF